MPNHGFRVAAGAAVAFVLWAAPAGGASDMMCAEEACAGVESEEYRECEEGRSGLRYRAAGARAVDAGPEVDLRAEAGTYARTDETAFAGYEYLCYTDWMARPVEAGFLGVESRGESDAAAAAGPPVAVDHAAEAGLRDDPRSGCHVGVGFEGSVRVGSGHHEVGRTGQDAPCPARVPWSSIP